MAHVSFCAFSLSDGMESDRCVTSVLCLGQGISPARRYCVPPRALEGAGAGDQSVIPWPGSLFPVHWGDGGALIGLVPFDALPLSFGGLGDGSSSSVIL